MKIKSISITNVKSFNTRTSIEFDSDFNIIIGPNASGKSNLLDIISICLRYFFLISYNIQPDGSGKKRLEQAQVFSNIFTLLDKYFGSKSSSEIEFTFIVKKEDLENISIYDEVKNKLTDYLVEELSNGGQNNFLNVFRQINWSNPLLKEDDLLSYKITNNVLETIRNPNLPNSDDPNYPIAIYEAKRFVFLKYLNSIQIFNLYQNLFPDKAIKPPFLFLSSYRGVNNDQDFQGNLSATDSSNSYTHIRGTTSKAMTSLINLATIYFSEKRRRMEIEANKRGYEDVWLSDPEVILVSEYLGKLGYEWDIHLVDRNRNIYEIILEKQGHKLLLSQASSGEKEIINYLFGIFALKITNGLIIIDEPELHLHPRWQLLLLELFLQLIAKTGNQFLITTHSAIFINVQSVSNLIRIYRQDNASRYVSLKSSTSGSLKDLLHIINSTNNEKIFFADVVVLVEGITDRLVFQKIVSLLLAKHQILSVVEVVEINGKGNIKKFRKYLKSLEIPYYFITDLDYINQFDKSEIKQLFTTDLGAVENNAIKNPKSTDGKKLVEILEEGIKNNDLMALKKFLDYIKSFRRKLRENLTIEEKTTLDKFIISRQEYNEYILTKGDIEKYFPEGLSAKDLDNVLELLKEPQFLNWQQTTEYKLLEQIIVEIFKKANFISNQSLYI